MSDEATPVAVIQRYLTPGDRVLIGQANGEPPALVRALIETATRVRDVTAYCGYTLGQEWKALEPDGLTVRGFIAHGAMRGLARRGLFDPLPWHVSAFAEYIERGLLPIDVVMLQVGPCDVDGFYPLGPTADYVVSAIPHARVVLCEVNDQLPRTRHSARVHRSQVTATAVGDSLLAMMPERAPSSAEGAVAENVARLVPDGSAIQLGLGPLSTAVMNCLAERKRLRVISGMGGDWLVDCAASGALAEGPDAALIGLGVGSQRFYDFVTDNPRVRFTPTAELVSAARMSSLIAINSAVEVDLSGQVNAEEAGGSYVGGIGGQVDFLRAARASRGGLGVVALSARHPDGSSRIVARLSSAVTTARSDVDVVVTEFGVADLRALSLAQRRVALAGVAAPEFRDELNDR